VPVQLFTSRLMGEATMKSTDWGEAGGGGLAPACSYRPDASARIAGVSDAVAVRVRLLGVEVVRTVINPVVDQIPIPVGVAHVADSVEVDVLLAGIGVAGTVVAGVAAAVGVAVG